MECSVPIQADTVKKSKTVRRWRFAARACVFIWPWLQCDPMSSRMRSVLILIAMLWQAIGVLGPISIEERADQMAHLVVHTQEVDHHHHADQSLHVDESGVFDGHQHTDGGSTPTGLVTTASLDLHSLPPAIPAMADATPYIPPSLDGLLRPPMTRS